MLWPPMLAVVRGSGFENGYQIGWQSGIVQHGFIFQIGKLVVDWRSFVRQQIRLYHLTAVVVQGILPGWRSRGRRCIYIGLFIESRLFIEEVMQVDPESAMKIERGICSGQRQHDKSCKKTACDQAPHLKIMTRWRSGTLNPSVRQGSTKFVSGAAIPDNSAICGRST